MVESKLSASEICVAECHGTGTALGDPIEVSALRMVMQDRPRPILNTSAKTNCGHLEASAGMAGVIKCVNLLNGSCSPPNCHLRMLNPHMDTAGYPVYFNNELSDTSANAGISGVSSFGFGGTNARGDLWARCTRGARKTTELDTGEWIKQRHLFFDRVFHYGKPGPHNSDQVYVCGSWDAFWGMHEMERVGLGEYRIKVVLGETGSEHFRIVVNQDVTQCIHPGQALAGMRSPAQGPDKTGREASWLINGNHGDDGGAGAVYEIRLVWTFNWEQGECRTVTWTPVSDSAGKAAKSSQHNYSIMGTWTAWHMQDIVPSKEEEGLWTTSVRLGLGGQEEFQLARDRDWCQVLHPATSRAKDPLVPLCGPDNQGHGRNWLLQGLCNEVVSIQLRVLDGQISVTTASEGSIQTWHRSSAQADVHSPQALFSLCGSWNGWASSPMRAASCLGSPAADEAVVSTSPQRMIYQCSVVLGERGYEEFQVVIDDFLSQQFQNEGHWRFASSAPAQAQRRLYPHQPQAGCGQGLLCGPDSRGHGFNWKISGEPGQEFLVTLDPNEEDSQKVIWWREVREEGFDP